MPEDSRQLPRRNSAHEGDALILPPGGITTVMQAVEEALGHLGMTQCPYFDREEKCDSGCYSEPACITDQPTEGWVKAAIKTLERAMPRNTEGCTCGTPPFAPPEAADDCPYHGAPDA